MTSSEGGEREANEVLFRSGEGESVKRATTSRPAVRERERPAKSCLDLERVRECEESNYKR